jgi:hypothetical protein
MANPAGGNTIAFTFGGQYTRAFTPLLSLTLDASYLKSRGDFRTAIVWEPSQVIGSHASGATFRC